MTPEAPRTLLAVTGRSAGIRWALDKPKITIGRSSASDLQLLDESVSRQHVVLEARDAAWVLRDLGSQNGCRLNGVRVTGEAVLSPGDVVEIGSTTFVFEPALDYLAGRAADVIIADASPETAAEVRVTGHERAAAKESAAELLLAIVARGLGAGTPDDMLSEALATVAERFGAERAFMLRASSEEGGRPRVVATFGAGTITVSRTIVDRVLVAGSAVFSGDAARDVAFKGGVSLMSAEIRSLLAAPLVIDGRPIGMVHLDRRAKDAYGAAELDALVPVSNVLALVLLAAGGAEALKKGARRAHKIERPIVIAESPVMKQLVEDVRRAARASSSVLLTGETGTGKEVLARLLHAESERRAGPFVAVNAGALPANLQESELFGHEKGAFTGADREKPGLFEVASGGTIFLDEVGECAMETQVKLLRVLQERALFRLGATRPTHVDVRVVAATSRPIDDLLARGALREDLYYRLAVIHLRVPPLRDRPEDVPALATAFARELAREAGLPARALDAEVLRVFGEREWRGNVRELRNVIERLVILGDGPTIRFEDLPTELVAGSDLVRRALTSGDTLAETIARVERELVVRALARTGGVKSAVADALGISRVTLDAKLKLYGIEWKKR
ncbi:sigma 54-interacting transcriptional regulator [Myxococcota bacterium]|nr:sigma 54-interacting transcriptional regulator [Myxococcota bacterium]